MSSSEWSKETSPTQWGFRSLSNIPSQQQLSDYYAGRYYQENLGIYQQKYEELESTWLRTMIERKYQALRHFAPSTPTTGRYLDVGCGEGHTLDFFHDLGWNVLGIDFSIQGVRNHHPDLEGFVRAGDLFESLDNVIAEGVQFDVIWLDNVLEHVVDPFALLSNLKRVLAPSGALVLEVPNDFSIVQLDLAAKGVIDNGSWVFAPDHISYFTREGLRSLAEATGWSERGIATNIPIDWFLYHPASNYYANPSVGKDAHRARMMIEMLISDQDPQKALNLSIALAELGLGREIMAVYTITGSQ